MNIKHWNGSVRDNICYQHIVYDRLLTMIALYTEGLLWDGYIDLGV